MYFRHLCHRCKGLLVVDLVHRTFSFCYKLGFVSVDSAIGIILDLVYPSATNFLPLLGGWDKVPFVVDHCMHLLLHGFRPLRFLGCFGEAFWLLNSCHLHHECFLMSCTHCNQTSRTGSSAVLIGEASHLPIQPPSLLLVSHDWYTEVIADQSW